MAIGDFPGIPQKYIPRLRVLMEKLDNHELTMKEIGGHALSSLGRVRIDSEGISIQGDFGFIRFEPSEFRALVDSLLNVIDYLPMLKDKELLIKFGEEIYRIKLGLRTKILPAGVWELSEEGTPGIEIINGMTAATSLLSYLIGDMDGVVDLKEKGFKIYRLEEFVGWSVDWEAFSKFINMAVPALVLTTKGVADRVQGPAMQLWDELLTRCGV